MENNSYKEYASKDWVSEKHSWDDLKNKPFYDTITYEPIIQDLTVTTITDRSYANLDIEYSFEIGGLYEVVINGVKYTDLVASEIYDTMSYVGTNLEELGEGSEPPFCILSNEGWLQLYVLTDGEYTVSISKRQNSVHYLDPKYIKDMYYSESIFQTLIEEQSLTTVLSGDSAYAKMSGSLYLTVGQTYTVIFDGTTYECVAYEYPDWNTICIGNGSIIGATGGNGEPFCIDSYSDGEIYLDTSEAGTHIVKISGDVETVYKIDEKYLPDVDNTFIIHASYNGDGGFYFKESGAEIKEAIMSHKNVVIIDQNYIPYYIVGWIGEGEPDTVYFCSVLNYEDPDANSTTITVNTSADSGDKHRASYSSELVTVGRFWEKMESKANVSHTHVASEITDVAMKEQLANLESQLETKADVIHTHNYADLNNKPFYESTEEIVVLPEQTLEIDGSGAIDLSGVTIVDGSTYIVTFNGTKYEGTAWYDDYLGAVLLGNGWLVLGSYSFTGEPFCLKYINGVTTVVTNASGSYTVEISHSETTVYTIDPKYLPDTVVTKADLEAAIGTAIGGSY